MHSSILIILALQLLPSYLLPLQTTIKSDFEIEEGNSTVIILSRRRNNFRLLEDFVNKLKDDLDETEIRDEIEQEKYAEHVWRSFLAAGILVLLAVLACVLMFCIVCCPAKRERPSRTEQGLADDDDLNLFYNHGHHLQDDEPEPPPTYSELYDNNCKCKYDAGFTANEAPPPYSTNYPVK